MRGRGGSLSSPPCVVEWIARDGGIRESVDDEDVRTVGCLLRAVRVGVHVVLDVEALHVWVEGADVLLRRLNNGHRFTSSASALLIARTTAGSVMSECPRMAESTIASNCSAPSGRAGGSVSAAVSISR